MNYHNNLLLLLVINAVSFISFMHSAAASDRDATVLLRVKTNQLEDPLGALEDWLGTSPNAPCNWTGVTCGGGGGVVALDLRSVGISGEFPADFCRISTLRSLDLSDNNLGGNISSDSISLCSHLLSLNLSSNYFVGVLPGFPAKFLNLTVLDFSMNNFSGAIPASFVNLRGLQFLSLGSNLLNESIPEFLSNLTELTQLVLAINPFRPSPLPANIGRLAKLEILLVSMANLAGEIPESIGNLISIKIFDVSQNNLVGEIPKSIGGMKKAEQIELFQNLLSGEIPGAFSGLTSLLRFDASQNNLTGKIPQSLAALQLESFNLNDNLLEGEIPEILALNPKLYELKLFNNSLSGSLPESLGMNSDLKEIDVSGNNLEGPLPQNLCYRKNLRRLIIFGNRISGTIPDAYGICSTLSYLRIQNNELYGVVPDAFWALNLDHIEFTNNKLEGSIPPSVSSAKGLTQLLISGNNFSGNLPAEICHLTELRKIDLSGNHFSGELPNCINKLTKLLELHMRGNAFSGEIPARIAAWREITQLDLSDNRLSGNIPPDLGALPVLTSLNLSNNMLSGVIPVELTKLKLNQLDISSNRLQGRVPVAFDTKFFLPSLIGNAELCSMNLKQLRSCSRSKPTSLVVVGILSALAFILVLSLIWLLIKNRKFIPLGCRRKQLWKITSFQRIRFSEEEVVLSLIDQNLVGSGGSGRVYRVRLKSGKIVAAKLLWEARGVAESEFQSEMETLGRIRHVNIVRLLFSFVGDKCKVLVYDYMENGSLGDVLHGEKGGVLLDWPTRFAIALGAAQGLAYLHHDCVPPIMHRDFKPNNILLDEELRPRVADFGLAKILKQDADEEDGGGMSHVAGSYGYIAPEYGYTMKVTEKSDVYSFGVVLLELVSGRRPNDPSFHENKNIVRWVSEIASSTSSCREGDWDEILDSRMDASRVEYEQVEKVLNVALLCTAELPINRPSMRRVVELLKY